ncbi:MAG: hypothetical protein JXB40_01340 [Candidatus Omnitrophica bacterium]|nr:hypothetical protein [Candidatus Omnitrophota bacterium]
MRYIYILIFSIPLITIAAIAAADQVDENLYNSESVHENGRTYRLLVDKDSGDMKYYMSEKDGWKPASECPGEVGLTYSDRQRLADMQAELTRMRDETWDDRYRY